MKNLIITVTLVVFSNLLAAQNVPQGLNYQAVVRDNSGGPLLNTPCSFYFSVLDGSPSGNVVYAEKHVVISNDFGLVNLIIGQGIALSGSFSQINWGVSAKFLKVELDVNNSGNIQTLGVSQFMSVPYALHAANTGSAGDNWGSQTVQIDDATLSGNGTSALPLKIAQQGATNNQVLKWNGNSWVPAVDNWGTQFVQTDASLTGTGQLASPLKLAQQGAQTGQVLKWNGTSWIPQNDVGGGAGDNWGSQTAQTDATLTGNGTNSSPLKIAQQSASLGQILKWNGSMWVPGADNEASYFAGNGIQISNDTIHSAWKRSSNDLYYNENGLVGIGLDPTDAKLHIIGNNTTLQLEHTSGALLSGASIRMKNYTVTPSTYWELKGGTVSTDEFSIAHSQAGKLIRMLESFVSVNYCQFNKSTDTYALIVNQPGSYGFNINRTDNDNDWEIFVTTGGHLELFANTNFRGRFDAVSGAYTQASDARLKEHIEPIPTVLKNVMQLAPVTYEFKGAKQRRFTGLLAQDVEKLFPELVSKGQDKQGNELLTLDYAALSVLAIKTIQEQQVMIEAQNVRIAKLEKKMESMIKSHRN